MPSFLSSVEIYVPINLTVNGSDEGNDSTKRVLCKYCLQYLYARNKTIYLFLRKRLMESAHHTVSPLIVLPGQSLNHECAFLSL